MKQKTMGPCDLCRRRGVKCAAGLFIISCPGGMTQLTERDELSSLAARIREQLARSCPRLSPETRAVFAIQIAIAEIRESAAQTAPRHLGWLHDLN